MDSSLALTQEADAITTRPVLRSTASTDHVANAVDGSDRSGASSTNSLHDRPRRMMAECRVRLVPIVMRSRGRTIHRNSLTPAGLAAPNGWARWLKR